MGRFRILALVVLMFFVACSIEDDITGTAWDVQFSLITAPETLFVRDLADNDNAAFDDDSLLYFYQEIEDVVIRLGDSLRWDGAMGDFEVPLGPLQFDDLGSTEALLPFALLFPDLAAIEGEVHQIVEAYPFNLVLPFPDLESIDWVAFSSSLFYMDFQHNLPFSLEALDIRILNEFGTELAQVMAGQDLPPDFLLTEEMPLSGLLTSSLQLQIQGVNLPMANPALLGGSLSLILTHETGQADSARALLQAQDFELNDSLLSDTRLYIHEGLVDNLAADLTVSNALDLPISFEIVFTDFVETSSEEYLAFDLPFIGPYVEHSTPLAYGSTTFLPEEIPAGDQHFFLHVSGQTHASNEFHTLRATDSFRLQINFHEIYLEHFLGEFRVDQEVEIEPSLREIDAFPSELESPHLEDVQLYLILENDAQIEVQSAIDILVEAAPQTGLEDTLLHVTPSLPAGSERMLIDNMGPLVSRMPENLTFSGKVILPAGSFVDLYSDSEMTLYQIEIPGRLRILSAEWGSDPELIEDPLPEEADLLSMINWIESRIPLGGRLIGEVALDSSAATWTSLFDIDLEPALWDAAGSFSEAVFDTLELDLSGEALAILREGDWWIRYEFAATTGQEAVELQIDQWLSVTTRLDAILGLEVE